MTDLQFNYIKSISRVFDCFNFYPDVSVFIACQFALESNFGTSKLAVDNNNHSGMKNPMVRISCSVCFGNSSHYWAYFHNLHSCCVDYVLCLQYHRPLSVDYDTPEHFARFISKFYCPEKDYITKIFKIYNQFKSQQNGN